MSSHAQAESATGVTIDVKTLGGSFDESTMDQWELNAARRALRNLKTLVGGQSMMDLLAEQIEAGDRFHKHLVSASGHTYRVSRADLTVRGLSASALVNWFQSQVGAGRFDDKQLLIAAHPEHYVEPPSYAAGMVEMIGGHLTRFKVALAGELPAAVREYLDESYPLMLVTAVLSLDDGTPFAYCLHHARDTAEGAEVSVRIVYPSAAPDSMIDGHCEHLAVEFRSWIRNAAAAQ